MIEEPIDLLEETSHWRTRRVSYWAGKWQQLVKVIPKFELKEFRAHADSPSNPYLKTVIRLPRTKVEKEIPVGVVSNTYTLVQHTDVADMCFEGIRRAGMDLEQLRCELGLSELGEWMNLRIYFPKEYDHEPNDGNRVGLRLECYNSVDGSSRLIILLGWLRFVCSNGMIIGETKVELRDIHNKYMDINRIPDIVCDGLEKVNGDRQRLAKWEDIEVSLKDTLPMWINQDLSDAWGKKAACRVFHICTSGYDVEITDPFALGNATEKPTKPVMKVPGAPDNAKNLYDVGQALSWVATNRNNAEERLKWQTKIPELVESLAGSVSKCNGYQTN